jgi:hypothetical protein
VLQLEAAKKEFCVHTHTRPFRARPFQQAASFCGSKNLQELSRVNRLLTSNSHFDVLSWNLEESLLRGHGA